jgi:hypothetical protein
VQEPVDERYQPPQASLDHEPTGGPLRPSLALVIALVLTQAAFVMVIALTAFAFAQTPWVGSLPLGVLVGGFLFGILESRRRARSSPTVSKVRLALASAAVWPPFGLATFGVIGAMSGDRYWWVAVLLVIAAVSVIHFAVTLLGLWLGLQASFD